MNRPTTTPTMERPRQEVLSPTVYPDSDGNPVAENSLQLRWIVYLDDNFCWLFQDRKDVAFHTDLLRGGGVLRIQSGDEPSHRLLPTG